MASTPDIDSPRTPQPAAPASPETAPEAPRADEAPAAEAVAEAVAAPARPEQSRGLKACAWLGALAAAGGWLLIMWAPVPSVICSVAAVALSAFGLRRSSGLLRDMCITAIIAAGVLLLVYALFYGALAYFDSLLK